MDEVRSWFEVPAIAHYFNVFKTSFDLPEFDIEDFEETLFLDSAENVSSFLPDLVIRLLRGLYKTKDGLQVTTDNYESYLKDLLQYHYVTLDSKENPVESKQFKYLSKREKVVIIHDMCNWRLELEDAMELTKNLDADVMRVEPVGRDDDGNVYWYFYGTRLYTEGFAVSPDKVDACKPNLQKTPTNATSKSRKRKTKSGRTIKKRRRLDQSPSPTSSESEAESEVVNASTPMLKLNISKSAWDMCCSSLEEWEQLISRFKSSRSKVEKELYRQLQGLFETIPEIFQERERAVQRKLLAMAPRRASDRISLKMQQREEEERKLEQERLQKAEQKAKEAKLKQEQVDKEKALEREKRCMERERLLAERALRVKQREEQKLFAENPELVKDLQINHTKSTKSGIGKYGDDFIEDDDIHKAMDRIMEVMVNDDDAWPFLEPVKPEEAPHYYEYIKQPMDFRTMREKIKRKEYENKHQFADDMYLIFDNCETYNGTYSSFTKLANIMKKIFEKLVKQEFIDDVIKEEDDIFEIESPTNGQKKSSIRRSKGIKIPPLHISDNLQHHFSFTPDKGVIKNENSHVIKPPILAFNVNKAQIQPQITPNSNLSKLFNAASLVRTNQTGDTLTNQTSDTLTNGQINQANDSRQKTTQIRHVLTAEQLQNLIRKQPELQKLFTNSVIPGQTNLIRIQVPPGSPNLLLQPSLAKGSLIQPSPMRVISTTIPSSPLSLRAPLMSGSLTQIITPRCGNVITSINTSLTPRRVNLTKIKRPKFPSVAKTRSSSDNLLANNDINEKLAVEVLRHRVAIPSILSRDQKIPALRRVQQVVSIGSNLTTNYKIKLPSSTTTKSEVESSPSKSYMRSDSHEKVAQWLQASVPFIAQPTIETSSLNSISKINEGVNHTPLNSVHSREITSRSSIKQTNILDLQKAALQAAAVNQIQTKLQMHLQQTSSPNPNVNHSSIIQTLNNSLAVTSTVMTTAYIHTKLPFVPQVTTSHIKNSQTNGVTPISVVFPGVAPSVSLKASVMTPKGEIQAAKTIPKQPLLASTSPTVQLVSGKKGTQYILQKGVDQNGKVVQYLVPAQAYLASKTSSPSVFNTPQTPQFGEIKKQLPVSIPNVTSVLSATINRIPIINAPSTPSQNRALQIVSFPSSSTVVSTTLSRHSLASNAYLMNHNAVGVNVGTQQLVATPGNTQLKLLNHTAQLLSDPNRAKSVEVKINSVQNENAVMRQLVTSNNPGQIKLTVSSSSSAQYNLNRSVIISSSHPFQQNIKIQNIKHISPSQINGSPTTTLPLPLGSASSLPQLAPFVRNIQPVSNQLLSASYSNRNGDDNQSTKFSNIAMAPVISTNLNGANTEVASKNSIDVSSNSLSTSLHNQSPIKTNTNKLVLNQTELVRLHQQGRLMMSPTGQIIIINNTVSTS